jgi:transposase-like protein
LRLWFYAIYLMSSTRCGISAKQIQRETGVTYKTAWRMFNKIRELLAEDSGEPVGGGASGPAVEVDETYHGGRRKRGTGRPMRGDKTKSPVLGIVERKGRIVARTIPDCTSRTLLENVKQYVLPKSTVYTDELKAYGGIGHMKNGYEHKRINHTSGIYVMGDVHTNTVEGFWSLLKRGIGGTYHAVSQRYLQMYLNEYAFRYNHRDDPKPMFMNFVEQIAKA